jgi:hypothetical protein
LRPDQIWDEIRDFFHSKGCFLGAVSLKYNSIDDDEKICDNITILEFAFADICRKFLLEKSH